MGFIRPGWLRGQSRGGRLVSPAYPRIASGEEGSTPSVPGGDLFAFDGIRAVDWDDARIEAITPVASVSEEDVLRLAARAVWPGEHLAARAIAAAARERLGAEQVSEQAGIWHLSAGRGIQGNVNGFHVLIGNEQLMRDGGICLTEDVQERLAHHANRGWQTILVAARAPGADREEAHRSLIGLLAVAPGRCPRESIQVAASCDGGHSSTAAPEKKSRRQSSSRPGRLPWQAAGLLIFLVAAAGLFRSAFWRKHLEERLAAPSPGFHLVDDSLTVEEQTASQMTEDVEHPSSPGKDTAPPLEASDAFFQLLLGEPSPGSRPADSAPLTIQLQPAVR